MLHTNFNEINEVAISVHFDVRQSTYITILHPDMVFMLPFENRSKQVDHCHPHLISSRFYDYLFLPRP